MLTMRSRVLWPLSVLASALLLAGCGSSSTPTASEGTSFAKTAAPKKSVTSSQASPDQWHRVGMIASQETLSGHEAGVHHLWLLTQLPATVNHAAEYQEQMAMTTGTTVSVITPPLMPPGNRSETAWGRTTQGTWWVAFVGQNHSNVVRTVLWKPGQTQWTRLPNLTLNPPSSNDSTTPSANLVRGRDGNGWLVSNYSSGFSNGAQTIVYHLNAAGWHVVHTFPLAANRPGSDITWQTPGPTGSLYVNPYGPDNPVTFSHSGTTLKTISIPQALDTHWGQQLIVNGVNVVMSNSGVSYAIGNSLWQWQGPSLTSLIPTGSILASSNGGYTWQGFWQNQPVVSNLSANAWFVYHDGHWMKANALTRPDSNASVWKQHTLWAMSTTNHIWTKTLASADLP